MPWDFLLLLVVLGALVPWRAAVRVRRLLEKPQLGTTDRLALYASTIAFQWAAAAIVLWRCAVRHLGTAQLALAIPHPRRAIFAAAVLVAVFTANQLLALRRLAQLPEDRRGFLGDMARRIFPCNTVEALAFFALVATVALCEEFLYRGFVQGVFDSFPCGFPWLGLVVSAVFFSFAHIYQGKRGLVVTFLVGLLFAVVRFWTGSLVPSVMAHFAADLVAGLGGAGLLASGASTERAGKGQER
jgi:membrane protease YdiL (CAAX protease family)